MAHQLQPHRQLARDAHLALAVLETFSMSPRGLGECDRHLCTRHLDTTTITDNPHEKRFSPFTEIFGHFLNGTRRRSYTKSCIATADYYHGETGGILPVWSCSPNSSARLLFLTICVEICDLILPCLPASLKHARTAARRSPSDFYASILP